MLHPLGADPDQGGVRPRCRDDLQRGFAWLQQVAGPVRDLDVYLLAFTGYQDDLPASLQSHLDPLRDFLFSHYEEEQRTLVQALELPQLKHLSHDWRTFLQAPVPESSSLPNAERRIKDVADERVWRLCRRVLKEGRVITSTSPPEELHEMRKSSQKLRYLVEFFASLCPTKDTSRLVKRLKVLLDKLGGFQDLAVQAIHLREIAERMREEKCAPTDTLFAMGMLVGQLLDRQQRERARFAEIFGAFDDEKNRALLQQLFAPKRKGVQGT